MQTHSGRYCTKHTKSSGWWRVSAVYACIPNSRELEPLSRHVLSSSRSELDKHVRSCIVPLQRYLDVTPSVDIPDERLEMIFLCVHRCVLLYCRLWLISACASTSVGTANIKEWTSKDPILSCVRQMIS